MFSLSQTGTVAFDTEVNLAALPRHLANCLKSVDASKVVIHGDCVAFTGGIFRLVANWNVLVSFGSGDLTVDGNSRKIHYRVSIRQLALVGTVMVMVLVGALFLSKLSVSQPLLLFMPLMWLWFVGGNLIIGLPRFKHFVERSLATAPRLVRQPTRRWQE